MITSPGFCPSPWPLVVPGVASSECPQFPNLFPHRLSPQHFAPCPGLRLVPAPVRGRPKSFSSSAPRASARFRQLRLLAKQPSPTQRTTAQSAHRPSAIASHHPSSPLTSSAGQSLWSSSDTPRSASSREQKQIAADIEAGSKKFGRKLLTREPSHRRQRSAETITPVTVLTPTEPEQDERRGRKSTSSQRPKLPKRGNSMR